MIGHSMLGLAATVGFGTGVFFLTLALEPDVGVGSIITSSLAALTVMPLLVGAGAHVGARRNGGVGRYGYAVLGAAVGSTLLVNAPQWTVTIGIIFMFAASIVAERRQIKSVRAGFAPL
ncbi:MAG: hypothetical protein AAF411_21575, partial [Myxococcota bacterium]